MSAPDPDSPPAAATTLTEASVLAEASQRTGLDDFGTDEFREPLRILLDALDREGRLHEVGRATQRQRIVDLLVNRLRSQIFLARHAEIADEAIEAPIVIVGFPRTGTTMLHRTIASAPGIHSLKWWESRNPAPFDGWTPANAGEDRDPRIADAEEQIRVMLEANPDLAAVHPFEAEGPDEEIMLLEHAFMSGNPVAFVNVPSYLAHLNEADSGPAYAYLKRMLQFIQWQKRQRGETADRWVLKTPHHLYHLDLVLETFPGATIIQTHRDPRETLPSFASLNTELVRLGSDDVRPKEVGAQWFDRLARSIDRCMRVRDSAPPERFIDVDYRDAVADPIAVVRRIYDRIEMPWSPEAEVAMKAWAEQNRRELRPTHEYSLGDFGFTEASIDEAFGAYRRRFLPPPSSAESRAPR